MIKYLAALVAGATLATVAWWTPSALTTDSSTHTATVDLRDLPAGHCWFEVYKLDGKPNTEPICEG